ncbi:glycosyltransferase family 2 protein [Mesoflavibacter zeaxanthinifaciens]|uniref:glycosyltransferase family 2 protein n=1 Tax=Mesoflavibacter zeaxanthinifaciens TaxID=393060 RepID=UPI003A8C9000
MLSILITHYGRPDSIVECLERIRALDLSMPFEIIVSDDGSDSKTQQFLKTLKIDTLLLSEENKGLASNLNKGLNACRGNYILYIQEDFLVQENFVDVIEESFNLLKDGTLDMIRYCANYRFKHLIPITKNINKIPRFSLQNFNINTFQYSDNPFMTTPSFFARFGYFLEDTSGGYGETEYAIRILNSSAKIGITNIYYFKHAANVASVMDVDTNKIKSKKRKGIKKKVWRFARALRQHLEWILYNPQNRRLYSYFNKRKAK